MHSINGVLITGGGMTHSMLLIVTSRFLKTDETSEGRHHSFFGRQHNFIWRQLSYGGEADFVGDSLRGWFLPLRDGTTTAKGGSIFSGSGIMRSERGL